MYLSFFRLKEFPFSLTPDPRFLFMSRSHREAFDHLLFGIHQRHGFIEVVGGIGTGKTTLCRALLEELDGKIRTALIFNTFLSESELLRTINEEFAIDASGSSRKQLIDVLNRFLIDQLAKGGNACLVIDECQNLGVPVLEQVRMLSNLETESEKLLQIVMLGQPEFHHMLKSAQLRQLDERIHVRSFLEPLDEEDTRAYIAHRLTVAGSQGDIHFAEGALRRIYEYSQGNPRRINTICDRCLLIAYSRESSRITEEHARQAILELQGVPPASVSRSGAEEKRWWPLPLWFLLSLLGLIGVAGGWLLGRVLMERSFAPSPSTSSLEGSAYPSQSPLESHESSITTPLPDSTSLSPRRFFSGLSGLTSPSAGYRLEDGELLSGMKVTQVTLSWHDLMRFQRACLLEFMPAEGPSPAYGIFRGISEKGIWVQEDDSGLRLIPKEELAKNWFGKVWIFLPANDAGSELKAGVYGEAVIRLQADLVRLGYRQEEPTGLYDAKTEQAVMAFQEDMDLALNGVAGPKTLGMMLQLLGEGEGDR
jgi:general secretion pathway protein A